MKDGHLFCCLLRPEKETPLRWSRSVGWRAGGVSVFSETSAASTCGVNAETAGVPSFPGVLVLAESVASMGGGSHNEGVITERAVLRVSSGSLPAGKRVGFSQ